MKLISQSELADFLGLPLQEAELPDVCPVAGLRTLIDATVEPTQLAGMLPESVMRQRSGHLDPRASETVYRITAALLMSRRVFGCTQKSQRFLLRPHPMLEGQAPLACAAADTTGLNKVEALLGRLHFGTAA